MIKAIAFESIENKGRYVADGVEMAFMGDEDGNVEELEYALLVIRNDLQPPKQNDVEEFYQFMSKLKFFHYDEFRKMSKPVTVEITMEQLQEIRERNEW